MQTALLQDFWASGPNIGTMAELGIASASTKARGSGKPGRPARTSFSGDRTKRKSEIDTDDSVYDSGECR